MDTCTPDTEVQEAARMMVDGEVGSLAVVRDSELVGIVTERDLLRAIAEESLSGTVGSLMTPVPDTLSPETTVEDAAYWMMAAGYRHIPVVEGVKLVGMVSIKDLLWVTAERLRQREEERRQ
ncbi:MAG: CBS domain-containing protein [Acidimicrobiia bacterium]